MAAIDMIVIGSGSGGMTVAYTAIGFGKKVLMIDRNKPGGECTWSGCIPSKALINQANDIHTAGKYATVKVDTASVMSQVRDVIDHVYAGESIEVLKKDGIDFVMGEAKFVDAHHVEVNGTIYEGKKIVICTGSSPMVPPIDGLKDVPYLTNDTFFRQEDLPKSMLVLGAGAIGMEMAQAMTRLGVEVQVVEMADSILPREDKELTDKLQTKLEAEGCVMHVGTKAVGVTYEDGQVHLTVEKNGAKKSLVGDKILLALGRRPNIEALNLEAAGIAYNKKGITVDDYMRTSAKGVYAVGDVAGPYLFSHMANVQGIQAVQNAVLPVINRKVNYDHVAWTTFTSPELATAGMTEAQARERYGDSIRVYRRSYDELDRAKTKPGSLGEVKLICNRKGKILGCSILGDRAGEMISEVQVIKTLGKNVSKLSGVIHPYPTYSEILNKIGKKAAVDNLFQLPVVRWFTS